ncbi:methyltransferase domain-containing protein [Streptomyces sp. NPDC002896]|uniref:methyltransferase domain-containing protein n=1 Tax=Streptomyces sp. NPDC002896 TaxID=3154438 RepID=UPI003321AC56
MTRTDSRLLNSSQTQKQTQNQTGAGRRFDALAALFDPTTFRHIERLGISPGRRCWEVGAYGASVATWLAKKVGPTGRVLVTDTDTSRVALAARPPIEVRRHDVGTEPLPAERFDIVHARHVLVHLPDHAPALQSMVKALRPGGHLLVEDTDPALQPLLCPDEHGPAQELANRLRKAFRALLAERGADLSYGRSLPRLMREAGLHKVEAEVHFPLASPACAELETATVQEVRAHLVAAGLATDEEIDRHLMNVASGEMDLATAPMISAWGRKE